MYTKFTLTRQKGYTTLGETPFRPETRVPTFTETDLYRTNEVQKILSDYNLK